MEMKDLDVTPRVLADDMLITSFGYKHLTKFEKALDHTHAYLKDMGAAIAPSKSLNSLVPRKGTRG